MKALRLTITLLFSFIFTTSLIAGNYTWTGTTDTDWGTSTNWSPNGIPDSGDTISISTTANAPVLDQARTITQIAMNSGTLDLNTYTLSFTGKGLFYGGTITNGKIYSSSGVIAHYVGTTMDCKVSTITTSISLRWTEFMDSTRIERTGSGTIATIGGNKYQGYAEIVNSGSGVLRLSDTSPYDEDSAFADIKLVDVDGIAYRGTDHYFGGKVTMEISSSGITYIARYGTATFDDDIDIDASNSGAKVYFGTDAGTGNNQLNAGGQISHVGSNVSWLNLDRFTYAGKAVIDWPASVFINDDAVFEDTVDVEAPAIVLNGGWFKDTTSLKMETGSAAEGSGGNRFDGATSIYVYASELQSANTYPDTFNNTLWLYCLGGDITLARGCTGTYFDGDIKLKGKGGDLSLGNGASSGSALASGYTVSIDTFNTDDLSFRGFVQAGTEENTLELTGDAGTYFSHDATFNGKFNLTTPSLYLNGGIFNDTTTIEKTGAGILNQCSGGNHFNAPLTFTHDGATRMAVYQPDTFTAPVTFIHTNAQLYLSYGTGSYFGDDATFKVTGSSNTLYVSYTGTNTFAGNIYVANASSSSSINFGASTGTSTLASRKTIIEHADGFDTGSLLLTGFTKNGTRPINLDFGTEGKLTFGASGTFNGPITYKGGSFYLNGCTFNNNVSLIKMGTANDISSGGNTFNGELAIIDSASGSILLCNSSDDDYNGNVSFTTANTGTFEANRLADGYYAADLTINGSADVDFGYYSSGSNAIFDGAGNQTINGTASGDFMKIKVNKSDGNVILQKDITITDTLKLVDGLIEADTNTVTLNDNSIVTGVADTAYVQGKIKKVGDDAFTYPVGRDGYYRPIGISAPSSATDAFEAEYFAASSDWLHSHGSKESSIYNISRNEFWDLSRTVGTSDVTVTLTWDSITSCGFDSIDSLVVVAWDASLWRDLGNGSTSGNIEEGSISSNGTSSYYGSYALASSDTLFCACPNVIADAGEDVSYIFTDSVTIGPLHDYSNLTYKWHTQVGLNDSTLANPWAMPDTTTKYYLDVDDGTCSQTDSIIVTPYAEYCTELASHTATAPDTNEVDGGYLPYAYDRFGNRYKLSEIVHGSCTSEWTTEAPANVSVGMFIINYCTDGVFDPFDETARETIEQVFSDVSNYIQAQTCSTSIATVNIQITAPPNTSGPLTNGMGKYPGAGTPFFIPEWELCGDAAAGILHGQVWRAINTGVNNPNMMDGQIDLNLDNFTWNLDHNTATTTERFDLYSVVLHELFHCLGFFSLLDENGQSLISGGNYYSHFDTYLWSGSTKIVDWGLNNLYTPFYSGAPLENDEPNNCVLSFEGDALTNITIGDWNEARARFEHFSDLCEPGTQRVMVPKVPMFTDRRELTNDDANALLDLGYELDGSFPQNGGSSPAGGPGLYAVNDGTWTWNADCATEIDMNLCEAPNNTLEITLNDLLNNDQSNATDIEGLEILVSVGNSTLVDNQDNTWNFYPNNQGTHILHYYPVNNPEEPFNINTIGNMGCVRISVEECDPSEECASPDDCDLVCNPTINYPSGTDCSMSACDVPNWFAVIATPDYRVTSTPAPPNAGLIRLSTKISTAGDIYTEATATELNQTLVAGDPYIFTYQRRTEQAEDLPSWSSVDHFYVVLTDQAGIDAITNSTYDFPDPNTFGQVILEEQDMLSNSWEQVTICFTPQPSTAFSHVVLYGGQDGDVTKRGNIVNIDEIHLMPDDYNAGEDDDIYCGYQATIGEEGCELDGLTYTYSWTSDPVGYTSSQDVNTINVYGTTTYSVERTINISNPSTVVVPSGGHGCTLNDDVVITTTPEPGTITISGTNCDDQTLSISLTGSYTYNWTLPAHATITSGSGTSSIDIEWENDITSGGLVCVDVINSTCTTTVCTTLAACCGTFAYTEQGEIVYDDNGPSATIGDDVPAHNGLCEDENFTIDLGSSLYVDVDLTIKDCNVSMTETRIVVRNGATLTVDNSWLHSCNVKGWTGIIVESGSELIVQNNSLIEDAHFATLLQGTCDYTFDNSVLNENLFHIIFDKDAHPVGTITDCHMLCQATGTVAYPPLDNVSPTYGTATVTPTSGVSDRTIAAISKENTSNHNLTIGAVGDGNLIENARIGIFWPGGNVTSTENTFRRINAGGECTQTVQGFQITTCGSAIYAREGDDVTVTNGNEFDNTDIGVHSDANLDDITIDNNTFNNNSQFGILVRGGNPSSTKDILITENTMTEQNRAIWCTENIDANITIGGVNNENDITIDPAGFLKGGVFILEMNPTAATVPLIQRNTINNTSIGIATWNTLDNDIVLNNVNIATGSFGTGIGVWNNIVTDAFFNNIQGTTPNLGQSGMFTNNCFAPRFICNTTENLGRGISINGPLIIAGLARNEMNDNIYGLEVVESTFWNLGTATMGFDNNWEDNTTWDTYREISPGQPEIFCSAAGVPFTPALNGGGVAPIAFTTETASSGFWLQTCPQAAGTRVMNTDQQKNMVLDALADTTTNYDNYEEKRWTQMAQLYMYLMVEDSVLDSDATIEAFYDSCHDANIGKLIRANNAFGIGAAKQGIADGNGDLFLDTLENMTTSIIPEDALRDVLVIALDNALDTIYMVDSLDYLIKLLMDSVYPDSSFTADTIRDRRFTAAQIDSLEAIAEACPYEYGPAVFMARALLWRDTLPYEIINECESASKWSGGPPQTGQPPEQPEPDITEVEWLISLYPNPNDGNMYLEYLGLSGEARFELYDLTGRKVNTYQLRGGEGKLNITEQHLEAGIYVYRVLDKDQVLYTGKVVIQH